MSPNPMPMQANSFTCLDCLIDTGEIGQYYMLKDELWAKINPGKAGMLCLDCVEKRLGRALFPVDFMDAPINELGAKSCPALARRFSRLNWQASNALGKSTGAVVKECFKNAFLAVYGRDELQEAYYVEGFGVAPFPMEHGWIEVGGEILDPTWALIYTSEEMQSFQYFGVTRLSQAEVRAYAKKHKRLYP